MWSNILEIQAAASIVVSILAAAGVIFMLVLRRSTPSRHEVDRRLAALKEEVDAVKDLAAGAHERLNAAEAAMKGLATKADIADIKVMLERQNGDRRALAEKVEGLSAVLIRIEEPLRMMLDAALRREGGA